MKTLSVEDMLNGKVNKYPLAIAVAKRAREITDDIILSGDVVEEKPVNLAIEEFKSGQYDIIEPDL